MIRLTPKGEPGFTVKVRPGMKNAARFARIAWKGESLAGMKDHAKMSLGR